MDTSTTNKIKLGKILFSVILFLSLLPAIALAAGPEPAVPAGGGSGSGSTSAPASKDGAVTENELFYQFNYKNADTKGTKIGAVNALPKGSWQETLGMVIKTLLNISGGLTLLSLTIGGVLMVTANGNTDMLDKGKKLVVASIAGLIIIAVSYGVVIGVSELQFFQPGTAGTAPTNGGASTPAPATPGPAGTTVTP